jgi:hypothetical protein
MRVVALSQPCTFVDHPSDTEFALTLTLKASFAFPTRAGPLSVTKATQLTAPSTPRLFFRGVHSPHHVDLFSSFSFVVHLLSVRSQFANLSSDFSTERPVLSVDAHILPKVTLSTAHDDGRSLARPFRGQFTCEFYATSPAVRTRLFRLSIRHLRNTVHITEIGHALVAINNSEC